MPFFYLSFCDTSLPKGQQFLGATVVEAANERDIIAAATRAGRNPGGEIAFKEVPDRAQCPAQAQKYFDRFVPRDEVMAEEHEPLEPGEEDSDIRDGTICGHHNPVAGHA